MNTGNKKRSRGKIAVGEEFPLKERQTIKGIILVPRNWGKMGEKNKTPGLVGGAKIQDNLGEGLSPETYK